MKRSVLAVGLAVSLSACKRTEGTQQEPKPGSSGRTLIQNKGSDTLVNVAQAWAEKYSAIDPSTAVAVTGGGSGTGLSALLNGTVDIANSSRAISAKEKTMAAERKIDPKEWIVGYDALAVFVHPSNPLAKISLATLAKIYGEGENIDKWSQLGAPVPGCPSDEIIRVSRQNNSGTYEYFREAVLGEGKDYRLGSRDMHGSKDVTDLVAKTPCAIGYSGLAYASAETKMLCIDTGEACLEPSEDSAIDRSYPIARPLFMYTNGEPTGKVKAYLDYVLSDAGQCLIAKMGYAPTRKVTCAP